MTEPAAVDKLFDELLHTEDDALRAARASTEPAGMPAIEVSAQHGHLLDAVREAHRAPVGCSKSARWPGIPPSAWPAASARRGEVVTLEYEPRHAEVARGEPGQGRGG